SLTFTPRKWQKLSDSCATHTHVHVHSRKAFCKNPHLDFWKSTRCFGMASHILRILSRTGLYVVRLTLFAMPPQDPGMQAALAADCIAAGHRRQPRIS